MNSFKELVQQKFFIPQEMGVVCMRRTTDVVKIKYVYTFAN